MFQLSFHPAALAELEEASQYYGLESEALRTRFVESVEAATKELRRFPQIGLLVREEHRRQLVRGFPYSLIYRIVSDELRIVAVMHQARRPFYWSLRR